MYGLNLERRIFDKILYVLHCSDYPHLFHLDPVITVIRLVAFHLIILNILRRTMAFASSIHNNLDTL
jgi:hypothetical protein